MKLTVPQLAQFLGGVVEFTKNIDIDGKESYAKGQNAYITPALLWLLSQKKIPQEAIMPHFRMLCQIEPQEAIELAKIVYHSPEKVNGLCEVRMNGIGANTAVEILINEQHSVLITPEYNVCVVERVYINGRPPITEMVAAINQPEAFNWLIGKSFDVYQQIKIREAYGRETWTAKEYRTTY